MEGYVGDPELPDLGPSDSEFERIIQKTESTPIHMTVFLMNTDAGGEEKAACGVMEAELSEDLFLVMFQQTG